MTRTPLAPQTEARRARMGSMQVEERTVNRQVGDTRPSLTTDASLKLCGFVQKQLNSLGAELIPEPRRCTLRSCTNYDHHSHRHTDRETLKSKCLIIPNVLWPVQAKEFCFSCSGLGVASEL